MLFAGAGLVRVVKNCDLALENAALDLPPCAAQFCTIRTSQPENNLPVHLSVKYGVLCTLSPVFMMYNTVEKVIYQKG